MTASEWLQGAISIVILVMGGLMKRQFDDNDKKHAASDRKHEAHFRHATDMSFHETDRERESIRASYRNDRNEVASELARHTAQDDKRFDRMETKMDIMADDIKDILKAVKP